jgi:hypothetical protein
MKTSIGRSYSRKRMRAGGRLAQIGAASLIVMMLAMALLPLTTSGVSAADNGNVLISQDTVIDTELIDDVVAEPTEIPTPEPEPDDPIVVEVEPGKIEIVKYGCEDDFEGDYDLLAQNCEPMNADFGVAYSGGEQFFNGSFTAENIAPGEVTVSENVPAGYGEPYVRCGRFDTEGNESGYAPMPTAQGSFTTGIEAGEYISCDWFNVPVNQDGTVTIKKWDCPEKLASVQEPTLDDYLAACTTWMNDVTFDLNYVDDSLTDLSGETGNDGDGTLIFSGVQPGDVEISEEIPSGYGEPVAYCSFGAIYDADGDGVAIAIDGFAAGGELPGGKFDHEMLPTETLYCDWFNFPDDNDDMTIIKWECPKGFDAYDATYDELFENCTQYMSGIDFTLSGEGENLIGVEKTDDTGSAIFSGLETGHYALTESVPSGYGEPVVYCDELDLGIQNYPVYGYGAIEFDYTDGRWVVCNWFNVPDDGGSIVIHKYTCAPGYDLEAYGADPKADCWEKTDGIEFSLYGDGFSDEHAKTGDFIPGAVAWDGLEAGDYTVGEEVPSSTIATFVICQWEEELGPFKYEALYPYSNGDYAVGNRIDLELYVGTDIVCHWYNIPVDHDGGDLVVIKYWCDGAIYDEAHCELYGGGADFSVEASNGAGDPIYFTTGWDGTAQLFLNAGAYTLTETDRQWCKAKSDQVDADGNLVVYDGQTSYVTVFNCGPGKEKEPPVKKFPNTGAGEMVSERGLDNTGTMGMLFSLGMVGALIALRTSRPQLARMVTRQDRGH